MNEFSLPLKKGYCIFCKRKIYCKISKLNNEDCHEGCRKASEFSSEFSVRFSKRRNEYEL